MVFQFPDMGDIFGDIFDPFFIFFIIIIIIGVAIFIIVLVFIFKMFFSSSEDDKTSTSKGSQENPYLVKTKTNRDNTPEKSNEKNTKTSICQYCGSKVDPKQKFCSNCGSTLE
ncbi:MAG: DUF4834 family protein [Candidatus Lokiarchaeota archaeon]|nr:DUF4834 family protein [Candidatus Lokiarchaeota archaeon]